MLRLALDLPTFQDPQVDMVLNPAELDCIKANMSDLDAYAR